MKKLVKESLLEWEHIEVSEKTEAEKRWADEMVEALGGWEVTQFGGHLPVEDVKIAFLSEFAADVTGSVQARPDVRFDFGFSLRNNRGMPYPSGWEAEVSIGSDARKGFFSKKASGKNVAPQRLLVLLSDMLDLKYRRR